MGWKRSKDGGMDFEVVPETPHERAIKRRDANRARRESNYSMSACTTTYHINDYPNIF